MSIKQYSPRTIAIKDYKKLPGKLKKFWFNEWKWYLDYCNKRGEKLNIDD